MGGRGSTSASFSSDLQQRQLEVILANNAMHDDYHTGIRSKTDIKTFKQAWQSIEEDESLVYPDFTETDVKDALKTGVVKVYSSNEIKQGTFVSPSKMMAQDYSADGTVHELEVKLDEVAWINLDEGQYANIKKR